MAGDDAIDKTQEIKLKKIQDYVHGRPDRRDVEYNDKGIFLRFPHPVDRLAAPLKDGGLGILDEHQLYSAIEIMLMHDVALKKLDIASMREFSHWFDWGEGPKHPETVYIRVMRSLERRHSHMVERICFQPLSPQDYVWIEHQQHNVRAAFNAVGAALANEKHRIRQDMEAEEGKSFDEICKERYETHLLRLALDKAVVKKPLANINKA